MIISNTKLTKKNEKGIALIFTLIMLSLLLILALSFTMDSMFSQKAAYNSANASSAGSLAQVQLKQVLSLVERSATNFTTGNVYSIDSVIGWVDPALINNSNHPELIDMLQNRLPVKGVLDDNNDNSCLKPNVKVNWNYIRNNGLDQRIIGRAAYIIIPDEKIPLPSLVDNRTSAPATYPQHNEVNDTETRIGKYVSEINVRAAIPDTVTLAGGSTTTKINEITDTLNWNSIGDGKYDGNWTGYTDIFDTINLEITPDLVPADKTEFRANLSVSAADDAEAFWADKNGDYKVDTDEFYKRFDLTRTDWDTVDNTEDIKYIENKILLDSNSDGVPDLAMEAWSDTDSNSDTNSKGLPWLALFGYKTDGTVDATLKETFASTQDRRQQIAANLKDYCDSDIRPTSDKDPANWLTEVPSFTGNELTPYINKIGIQVFVQQKDNLTKDLFGFKRYDVWSLIEISINAELINIYQPSFTFTGNEKIKISGTIKVKTTGYAESKPDDIPFSGTITFPAGVFATGYSSFRQQVLCSSPDPFVTKTLDSGLVFGGNRNIKVDVEEVIITKAVFYKDDTTDVGYDYVKTLNDTTKTTDVIDGGSGATGYCWYGFAAHDPRQNLNAGDWKVLTPSTGDDATLVLSLTGASGGPYSGMPNAENNSTYGGGGDTEDPTDGVPFVPTGAPSAPWHIGDKENSSNPTNSSTAYIRNAPMESPWELGFIHRGAKWQTINLKSYDSTKAISTFAMASPNRSYIAGGGAYWAGDANILDQIKMVPNPAGPQKINLKSSLRYSFDALFSKVRLGCDIDSAMNVNSIAGLSPSTGTEIDVDLPSPAYSTMRQAILDKFKNSDITTFTNLTRASVASIIDLGTNVTKTILISADDVEPNPTIALSAAVTDAAQEELIGKIVNLIKVGRQTGHFTIIVLAQTIKDVGGTGGSTISINKYADDETTNATKSCTIGTFDADIDLNNPEQSIYYDEITSEQKIMLKGRVLGFGQIKILSFQYID